MSVLDCKGGVSYSDTLITIYLLAWHKLPEDMDLHLSS